MEINIAHTLRNGGRVTSSYAEIYLNDSTCNKTTKRETPQHLKKRSYKETKNDDWTSPSDLLIDVLDLTPPFTSKITRGITHEGILGIGNELLEKETERFLKHVHSLITENDAAWKEILQQERATVEEKVKGIYKDIFTNKSKIMATEMSKFYEESLQELEDHLRSELQSVIISTRANILSDMNTEIRQSLAKEKTILMNALQQKHTDEIRKIKYYYKLILQNEKNRMKEYICRATIERNDALKAFCRQLEVDNITSVMYVMCTERKKCKIKQFLLKSYQGMEITENLKKIKERQEIIDMFSKQEVTLNEINSEWEAKIKKILQLFLKFISFSLKLLPEQTTFLLDFQKMVVLQLNEIHKVPEKHSSILISENTLDTFFRFEDLKLTEPVCNKEPIVVVGDVSDIPIPHYDSSETLPSNISLPTIKLQRQFLYAKCHKFEEIKELLEKERCKCFDKTTEAKSLSEESSIVPEKIKQDVCIECESSNELLLVEDLHRLHECPVRNCKNWAKNLSFPSKLEEYLDFTQDKYEIVKTILGNASKKTMTPSLIDPKIIVDSDLLFSQTNEPFHTVETQYSSHEELSSRLNIECPCVDTNRSKGSFHNVADFSRSKHSGNTCHHNESDTMFNNIIIKRQNSLKKLLQKNPNLLKMFSDESFGFE